MHCVVVVVSEALIIPAFRCNPRTPRKPSQRVFLAPATPAACRCVLARTSSNRAVLLGLIVVGLVVRRARSHRASGGDAPRRHIDACDAALDTPLCHPECLSSSPGLVRENLRRGRGKRSRKG